MKRFLISMTLLFTIFLASGANSEMCIVESTESKLVQILCIDGHKYIIAQLPDRQGITMVQAMGMDASGHMVPQKCECH